MTITNESAMVTGGIALRAIPTAEELIAENEELRKDRARFEWCVGLNWKVRDEMTDVFLRGSIENWTVDQWRAAIDKAMK